MRILYIYLLSFVANKNIHRHRLSSSVTMNMDGNLLISQKDSYVTSSVNTIVNCSIDKIDSSKYNVILDDSCLYAEGGGQPFDLGYIDDVPIMSVYKCDDYLEQFPKAVTVSTSEPIEIGKLVTCKVDWNRRYDHMQQHTSQHLFSALAHKHFQADTVGWSLGTDSITIDINKLLTARELNKLEDIVNEEILKDSKIDYSIHTKEDIIAGELENLRGAPKGIALNLPVLRLVNIAGIDKNPCGGTHLSSLHECRCLHIIGTSNEKGMLRVRVVAGNRALQYFRSSIDRENKLSSLLKVPVSNQYDKVDKIVKDSAINEKKVKVLTNELAQNIGASIVSDINVLSSNKSNKRLHIIRRHSADSNFLASIADVIESIDPSIVYANFILLCGDDAPVGTAKVDVKAVVNGQFILLGNKEIISGQMKDVVIATLSAKAGGRPGRLQGTSPFICHEKLNELESKLLEIIS